MAETEDAAESPLSGVSAAAGLATVARLLERNANCASAQYRRRVPGAPVRAAGGAAGRARPLVAVTADETAAQALVRDLRFFLASARPGPENDPTAAPRVAHLPWLETAPWADVSPDRRAIVQRMSTLFRLSQGMAAEVLVASAPALARRVVPRAAYARPGRRGAEGRRGRSRRAHRQAGAAAATRACRSSRIRAPSPCAAASSTPSCRSIASRCASSSSAISVESIRFFDPESQRTMRAVDEIYVHPVRETVLTRGNRLRDRLLEAGDLRRASVVEDAGDARSDREGRGLLRHRGADAGVPRAHGVDRRVPARRARSSSSTSPTPASRRSRSSSTRASDVVSDAARRASAGVSRRGLLHQRATSCARSCSMRGKRVEAHQLEVAGAGASRSVRFAVEQHRDLAIELHARARREARGAACARWSTRLRDWRDEGVRALIAVPNLQHAERLESLLKGYQIIPHLHRVVQAHDILDASAQRVNVEIVLGALGHGFHAAARRRGAHLRAGDLRREGGAARRPRSRSAPSVEIGLQAPRARRLRRPQAARRRHLQGSDQAAAGARGASEVAVDFLHLEYDGGALYLPVWRLNEVQPYAGAEGIKPKLDKLGGETWKKTRAKISKEVRQLAEELLQLYAQRKALPGPLVRAAGADGDDVPRVRGDLPVRGDARSAEGDRRRARRSRRAAARWIGWSAATSATARPRWRCAPRSRSCSAAGRWRCWRRRRCWSSSTRSPSPRAIAGCR